MTRPNPQEIAMMLIREKADNLDGDIKSIAVTFEWNEGDGGIYWLAIVTVSVQTGDEEGTDEANTEFSGWLYSGQGDTPEAVWFEVEKEIWKRMGEKEVPA